MKKFWENSASGAIIVNLDKDGIITIQTKTLKLKRTDIANMDLESCDLHHSCGQGANDALMQVRIIKSNTGKILNRVVFCPNCGLRLASENGLTHTDSVGSFIKWFGRDGNQ